MVFIDVAHLEAQNLSNGHHGIVANAPVFFNSKPIVSNQSVTPFFCGCSTDLPLLLPAKGCRISGLFL
jgi:hypothetical protein